MQTFSNCFWLLTPDKYLPWRDRSKLAPFVHTERAKQSRKHRLPSFISCKCVEKQQQGSYKDLTSHISFTIPLSLRPSPTEREQEAWEAIGGCMDHGGSVVKKGHSREQPPECLPGKRPELDPQHIRIRVVGFTLSLSPGPHWSPSLVSLASLSQRRPCLEEVR